MVDLSGLIDPRAVELFQGFMNRQAEAAMAVTGAPATTWSGRYSSRTQQVKIDLGTSVATVTWAGDIEYDAKMVIQPIWLLCRRGGRLEGDRLNAARDAFRIVFHENLHAVNQLGRTMAQAEAALQDPANRALEEGLTELYARRYLNAYLRELGVADLVPGILTANDYSEGTYPHFVPAVEVLAEGLSRRTGLSEHEVLRRLITIDCETRWQVVGELLFEAEGLAYLVPEADHADVKDRLTAALRQPFAQLVDLDGSNEAIIVASTAAGYDALGSFDREVEALRLEHDRTRGPAQLLDSILERQEQAALAVTGAHHITQVSGSVADFTVTDGSTVDDVLRKMCERAGEENQPFQDLAQYKEALHLLLEHDIYQSAGRFREVGMGAVPLDRGTVVFSEGLARALSDDRLNAYVDQLGLERIAPGLRDTASPRRLDPAGIAARAFVQQIGQDILVPVKGQVHAGNSEQPAHVEMDRDVLLRQLAVQDPELPWLRVTDLVYDSRAFGDYLDSDDIREVKDIIQQSMTEGFARVGVPEASDPFPLLSAEKLGRDAAEAGRRTMAELDGALRPPVQETPVAMHAVSGGRLPSDARMAVDLLTQGQPGPTAGAARPSPGKQLRQYGGQSPRPGREV